MKYYNTYLHKDEKYNKYLRTIVQYHKWLVKGGLVSPTPPLSCHSSDSIAHSLTSISCKPPGTVSSFMWCPEIYLINMYVRKFKDTFKQLSGISDKSSMYKRNLCRLIYTALSLSGQGQHPYCYSVTLM